MILIYQMLKVASRSWVEAARPAAERDGAEPVHVHFVNADMLAKVGEIAALPPQFQTIANRFLLRDMLRKGAVARAAIDGARARGEPIKVLSGMRDPVARALSLVHFFADFYGDTSRPLDRVRGGDAEDTVRAARQFWQAVLDGREPADGFARLLTLLIGAYRTWFADELGAVLGVPLGVAAFPAGAGSWRLRGDGVEALLYRVEDLSPHAVRHRRLLAEASEFLGVALPALPSANTAASRRSYPRYAAAREAFRLPAEMLDAIYAEPVVRSFYSDEEISAFRREWLDNGAATGSNSHRPT